MKAATPSTHDGSKPGSGPVRILVVDDSPMIAMLLREMLRGMGHEVCGLAYSEQQAVTEALRLQPDLMIVDVGLGPGSGVSAVERVLQSRQIAHVLMSGAPVDTGTVGGPVLGKPFLEPDLRRAIAQALAPMAG